MALKAKDINNATDMRNYVEGCLNDLVEGLSTVEETMVYMKEYTHRVIDLASASQKPDTSDDALHIDNVVGQSEQLHKLLQYLSDEDELVGNRTHQEIIDNFNQLG